MEHTWPHPNPSRHCISHAGVAVPSFLFSVIRYLINHDTFVEIIKVCQNSPLVETSPAHIGTEEPLTFYPNYFKSS
jgi:hypothetical protein